MIFETAGDLWGTAAALRAIVVEAAGLRLPVAVSASGTGPFAPLGDRPQPGDALWIGLGGTAEPYPRLSLGLAAQTQPVPAPAAAGGPALAPPGTQPLLRWELLDGDTFRLVEVIRDGTGSLTQSGVVELALPGRWQPAEAGRAPSGRPALAAGHAHARGVRDAAGAYRGPAEHGPRARGPDDPERGAGAGAGRPA